MLEGKCPKCGYQCFGWALRFPRHQLCPKCGVGLEITEDGRKVGTGYSPFTAERYHLDMPDNIPLSPDKEEDSRKEDY